MLFRCANAFYVEILRRSRSDRLRMTIASRCWPLERGAIALDLNLSRLPSWAQLAGPLQELQRIHVDEDGGLGNFFGVAIGEGAGQQFCELGFHFRFQQKLEAVFGFEAGERSAGGAED